MAANMENVSMSRGFRVQALDGEAGRVEQVIYWTDPGSPDFVIVDSGRWIFGRKAVLSVDAVEDVDVKNRRLKVSLSKEEVRKSPEFLPWT